MKNKKIFGNEREKIKRSGKKMIERNKINNTEKKL